MLHLSRASLGLYPSFINRVQTDAGMQVEYERRGMLKVALSHDESDALAASAAGLYEIDTPHSFLLGEDARRMEPRLTDRVLAGLMVPAYGYLAVEPLVRALVAAATRHGATFTRAQVLSIASNGGGASIVTDAGPLEADAVVVTAGSWSSALLGTAVPAVRPIRGQLLYLKPAQRTISRVVHGAHCYLVPWRDGTVLAGATVEDAGFDERSTPEGIRALQEAAADLVPALAGATVAEVRVGLRPRADDDLPVIGAVPDRPHVYCATGHYRNGIVLAPLTAAAIADLVLEGRERPEIEAVRPGRAARGQHV